MPSLRLGREAVRRQVSKAGGAASPLDRRHAGRSLEHPFGSSESDAVTSGNVR
jgi:hypothetical protein